MRDARFSLELESLTSALDRAIEKAGPGPAEKYRITPSGDGWQLEACTLTMAGTWAWKREYFSRNRREVEKALARRAR